MPYNVKLAGDYTWTLLGSLPAGLTLSPDGWVSGTPMAAGPAQFRLLAANANGDQASQACSVIVDRGPLAVAGCPLPDARRGEAYSASLGGVGGVGPYVFIGLGSLPPGLSLSTSGQMTGTPSEAGAFPFNVMLRDKNLAQTVQACSLTVAPPALRLTNSCPLPDAQAGRPYSVKLAATGGVAPYGFFIDGFLPDGLTADTQGNITGSPTREGGRTFTIYTFDSQGAFEPKVCSIAVTAPQVSTISLADPPATVAPAATNLVLQVRLAEPFTAAIEGKAVMNVTADTLSSSAIANSPDPRLAFANGQRTTSFSIPAGATSVNLPVASTGTVASTVAVSLTDLRTSGAPIAQNPVAKVFRIAAAAPSITSLCFTRTETGLDFTITGITTTRELTRAVLNIPGLPDPTKGTLPPIPPEYIIGATPGELTVSLTKLAEDYFGSAVNIRTGGAFTLRVPVTVDLAPNAPQGQVAATIFNRIGAAGQRTVEACQ